MLLLWKQRVLISSGSVVLLLAVIAIIFISLVENHDHLAELPINRQIKLIEPGYISLGTVSAGTIS